MTPKLPAWLVHVSDAGLCAIRKWWRPLVCISMGGSLLVNGVILPLITRTYPDLLGLAAVCGALAPFAWLRTQEKRHGISQIEPNAEPPI